MKKHPLLIISYNAPVILTFSLLCAAALAADYITVGKANTLLFSVYRSPLIDPLTYIRFFTHVFGHADMEHFYSNVCLLLVIGPMIEEKYGSRNLLLAIAVTAFSSGAVQYIFFPQSALLGASGIVFMLILLASMANIQNGRIPLTLLLVSAIYLGKEIVGMLYASDNVSHLTHIIGGLCGIFTGKLLNQSGK